MPDEKIDLRDRTFEFSRRIIRLVSALPKTSAGNVLGNQCLRSATSVGANYREAFRARSKAEFRAKIGDCLKEAEETMYWIQLIEAEELVKPSKLKPLLEECSELVAIFVSIHKNSKLAKTS